jgi:putative two-component system response regulator
MTKVLEKPSIVMVDDDSEFQGIMRKWLAPYYDHCGLHNGADLIDYLEAYEPDLLILDVRMPGLDGFELCKRIRADQRFAALPILFLTGCKEDEDFIKNLDVGGTAYLTKPVERNDLLSIVKELVTDGQGSPP